MNKYIFLYMGPAAADVNLDHPPLSQAGLDQWAQKIGPALVDRGSLFGSNGSSVMDNGIVHPGPLPLHGYSVVQAESINGAVSLAQGHPFLANGNQAYFEVQILELTTGERPLSLPVIPTTYLQNAASVPVIATPPTLPSGTAIPPQPQSEQVAAVSQSPEIPPVQTVQTQNPTELNIAHEEPESPDQDTTGQNQPPAGQAPGSSIQPNV